MTRQTNRPLVHQNMNESNIPVYEMVRHVEENTTTVDAPYQRGSVWTLGQRVDLIRSTLLGVPIPAIVRNDRMHNRFQPVIGDTDPLYAIIDGKQRLLTLAAWMRGDFAVPASWFPHAVKTRPDRESPDGRTIQIIEDTEETEDGAYVRYTGLTESGQRRWANTVCLPVATAHLASVQAEAEVYGLLNSAGTAQTDADLANAAAVAAGE